MGYILPVNSYRSQQYANRLMDEPHFAKVSRLQRVNQVASFSEKFEEVAPRDEMNQYKKNEKMEESRLAPAQSQHEVIGYVQPNPANLSPAIARVVEKGQAINAYV